MGKSVAARTVGAILAGGESVRMGADKADLTFDGETLLERTIKKLCGHFDKVAVALRPGQSDAIFDSVSGGSACEVCCVVDEYPGRGPIGGIHAVLKKVESELYFVTGCDMPFLDPQLGELMAAVAERETCDVVIPRMENGHLHPLCAVYRRSCLPHIEYQLRSGDNNRIIGFFDKVNVRYYEEHEIKQTDPEMRCLMNINTMEDLENALASDRKKHLP